MTADYIKKSKRSRDYIFFYDRLNDLYISDMRIIYDCDNNILPDLYAEGIIYEPKLINYPLDVFSKECSGMVVAEGNAFREYEQFLSTLLANDDYVINLLDSLVDEVFSLYQDIINMATLYSLKQCHINTLIKLMATTRYKRYLSLSLTQCNIPSHLALFYWGVAQVQQKSITFETFVQQYAFLFDYNMKPSRWETTPDIVSQVKAYPIADIPCGFSDIRMKTQALVCAEKKTYYVGWFEEIRRIITQKFLQLVRLAKSDWENLDCYLIDFQSVLEKREKNAD